jgi:hypothetical protein
MSSIIFEGNTYTFGATVSANPGTGTTSYVFGGLSSGSTFGFILRAFNGFGFSNFIGPAISKTLQQILESREAISSFSWSYQYMPSYDITFSYSGSTFNIFASSADLSTPAWTLWPATSGYSKITGFTAPDGSTTAWKFTTAADAGLKQLLQTTFLDIGSTYIVSYYMDVTGSSLGGLLRRPGGPNGQFEQIDPITGATVATVSDLVTIPVGASGWNRFNFRFVPVQQQNNIALFGFGGSPVVSIVIWGPQLEKDT